jgi:hypothetical protein
MIRVLLIDFSFGLGISATTHGAQTTKTVRPEAAVLQATCQLVGAGPPSGWFWSTIPLSPGCMM